MSANVPQMLDSASLRIQELAYGLKVRDVMTKKIFALSRNCTMRDVQSVMKNNNISGVPIVDDRRVVGIISMHDIIRALEPGYREVQEFDHSRRFGFGLKFIKNMVKDYNLWQRPMDDLCQKATGTLVKKIMYTPEEGEYVSIDATFNEAVHQLVVGHHQSLLVLGPDQRVKGVLRLTDVFQEVAEQMKPCEE